MVKIFRNNKHPMTSVGLAMHSKRSDTKERGNKNHEKPRKKWRDADTWWTVQCSPVERGTCKMSWISCQTYPSHDIKMAFGFTDDQLVSMFIILHFSQRKVSHSRQNSRERYRVWEYDACLNIQCDLSAQLSGSPFHCMTCLFSPIKGFLFQIRWERVI